MFGARLVAGLLFAGLVCLSGNQEAAAQISFGSGWYDITWEDSDGEIEADGLSPSPQSWDHGRARKAVWIPGSTPCRPARSILPPARWKSTAASLPPSLGIQACRVRHLLPRRLSRSKHSHRPAEHRGWKPTVESTERNIRMKATWSPILRPPGLSSLPMPRPYHCLSAHHATRRRLELAQRCRS